MSKNRTSTAGFTCFTRACAVCEKEPFRGPDDLAEIFLPGFATLILNVTFLRNIFMRRIAPPGIYEYVMARTRIFDDCFKLALDEGFEQIVILGAGMDTRALRFAQHNNGTRVFELDLPKIQKPKLDILRRKQIVLPEELTFVAIDFNRQDLGIELAQAGYKNDGRTLFLWEGISMYLQAEAVDQALNFIRTSAGTGSWLTMDYVRASVICGAHKYYGEEQIYATVVDAGECWTFGIDDKRLPEFLETRGFQLIDHYTPLEMQEKYLIAPDGRLFGQVNGTHCIALAQLL